VSADSRKNISDGKLQKNVSTRLTSFVPQKINFVCAAKTHTNLKNLVRLSNSLVKYADKQLKYYILL